MRRYSSYTGQYYGGYHANNVNVTNVTNITNVTVHNHSPYRSSYGGGYRHGRKHVHHGRPTKLTRFCATCGLLDYDKAARMSRGEMMEESAKVVAYGCRGLARSAGNIASNLGGAAKSICGAFVAIGDAIFGE